MFYIGRSAFSVDVYNLITLPIKRHWFELIASRTKPEEYRALTPRYAAMFKNAADENGEFWCVLRNGYSSKSPSLTVRVSYRIGKGKPECGAEPDTDYFVLSILDIKE